MSFSIFPAQADLKAYLGGAINASFDIEYISPFFETAHQQRMEEWLGTTLYDDLVDAVANNDATAAEVALLPYYQKALVWLALYDYIPFAEVQVTGSGVSRVENEQYKSAYKSQVQAIMENALTNGYEALERLLIFLEANKGTYTAWTTATGYAKYHGVMLNTATIFRTVYDKTLNRHTFESMFGCVEDAELLALVPLLGQTQYDALLNARKTGTYTSEALEKKAILLAQKISAHFTLRDALGKNWVQVKHNRVVQVDATSEQANLRQTTAPAFPVGARKELHDDRANAYIQQLRSFLDANVDNAAFAGYKAWKATLAAAEEAYQEARETEYGTASTTTCDTSQRLDWGTAFGFGSTGKTTRKGASSL